MGYAQKTAKQIPVTKEGIMIKEHFLAIITTCDLVSNIRLVYSRATITNWIFWQSFRFVERPAVRGLISYLNPKIEDEAIPKKTCMADTVNTNVEKLDNITIELIKVST